MLGVAGYRQLPEQRVIVVCAAADCPCGRSAQLSGNLADVFVLPWRRGHRWWASAAMVL
jgi:hypothetical protein